MAKKGGLGMGLDAIFDDNTLDEKDKITTVRLTDLEPNKDQPRKRFDEAEIQGLADSIRDHGLIQPIIVRPLSDGRYQIVAGERRWRASKMAGLTEIPIIIREMNDEETAKVALIENVQRADLNPIEEAAAYKQLMDDYDMTQDAIAKMVGKSRSVIANSLRLLNLPEEIQTMLKNNFITVGHAKALAGIDNEDYMIELAKKACADMLTVRTIEKLAADYMYDDNHPKKIKNNGSRKDMNFFKEMEISLSDQLGRRVRISVDKDEKGTITIDFFDKNDLESISNALSIL